MGRGVVKTPESMAIEVVRLLMLSSQQPKIARVSVKVSEAVGAYLNNKKRREIMRLEDDASMTVQILTSSSFFPEHLEVELRDVEGREMTPPV
jgi:ribonuclease E